MTKHTLIVVRHAKAQDYASGTDERRALTNAGKVQAHKLGVALRPFLTSLDDAFVSPAVRAQKTWEGLALGAGIDLESVNVSTEPVIYSMSATTIWDTVRIQSTGMSSIVVGHEPTISELARKLVKKDDDSPIEWGMPTGSAVILSCDRGWSDWTNHCANLEGFEHVPHR
ncbi:MAG: histidine phosphatase family protein [Scrofimicrobium sp.]